ncbi:disulfide bond formation protein B [Exiguobacterium sp. SH3S2]|uniref:disulfide oxidoreductase n=1 Tax=unclassified Exiguobacterium TaxID=2644629 RepID=UPI00103A620C|nr:MULTISPECIES: disulfide oxidoreductase [unclassified Exiguobacterium]TCI26473.1 disulfide bond formation protein B [Exiguobacterium sp. SH5S4]TCI44069.1 disulfide bond formation protein B [Exiguobacterium sp. SH3S3]TCI53598.1 disulfide bond formation protein B [Exiguobacterium sp. SH5S13]TCI59526.1 disulfide bond formation protein B [Exiguobacterium sp. SH3S2]TCI66435.1 disulfide bond formation protein B [Exiguobacterium sp. SH3S1]
MNQSFLSRYGLYLAWLVALTATLGSLYFSEIREFVPCELCWVQRIFMYPLVFVLGMAVFTNDRQVKKYVLPLAIVGGMISLYHYLVQKVPGFADIKPCVEGVPCNVQYINWFGFVTIPFLALTAFTLITLLLLNTKTDK